MISLALSVQQCDCPLSAASDAHDVAFVTPHWHYDRDRGDLELRVLADATDRTALERALEIVRGHEETTDFDLLAKRGRTGRARLTMGTTDVMGTIVAHGGYLTGPFENVDGSERWEVAFDDDGAAEAALAALDHLEDECELRKRRSLDPETVLEDVHAATIGSTVLDRSRTLTASERETLRLAVEAGYYDVPRSATLGDLADTLEVSDAAVSKALRRAERKLLEPTMAVLESVRRRDRT
ncbi:helix-turn-helix domain-containing protein [Halobiforma nitratireducens]|uniref:Bacterio-opsin activator HTH domain-containing protein n=1 Tax=Halobiforma nitratireducens JCM 10879 TaxID=1227454 RepID=M0M461_9EURY|nr:helix-turn-helix domain-containing protein [Halobiforma nitratireducens]EMA39155.1 bacterio-opsin activator HTH domain-containing protein [Halobiforma nitratireducens JCM 10879]